MNWIRRYFRHELLPLLSDLKLAIGLLLVIALSSASGTLIEQEEPLEFYQSNYPEHPALFGFLSWKVIVTLGLDHVYRTPWFLGLLILFGSTLAACTTTRQWPMLKVANRWRYYSKPRSFERLALSAFLPGVQVTALEDHLRQRRYWIQRRDETLYARQGLIGKIGPIFVHASMLLVLGGAIWGSITGFKAQAMIPSGSSSPIDHFTGAGDWAKRPDLTMQVHDFYITYSPEGRITQFYSDLGIQEGEQEVKRQLISVNHPLAYKGVTFYQADWSISSVKARLNKSPQIQLPVVRVPAVKGSNLWGTFVPTKPDLSTGLMMLVPDLQGTVVLYNTDGQLIGSMRTGMSFETPDGVTLYLDQVIGSTGLQIKSDPGIPWVYTGFGLLMLGVMMSYVSHNQIWALETSEGLYIGAKANRAIVTFEREFLRIIDSVKVSPQSPDSLLVSPEVVVK